MIPNVHLSRSLRQILLLDAGESIRAVSEYLGHSDPGFTLRTYTHLMPSSAERTRAAVDAAIAPRPAPTTKAPPRPRESSRALPEVAGEGPFACYTVGT